jgi:hypothetical protein
MLTASIHDPITGVEVRIIANTYETLRQRVVGKIDNLRKEIVDLFLYAGAILSTIFLLFMSTLDIPYAWMVVIIIVVAYVQRAPFWINPFAHIWYLRKCMRAWEQELERVTAPDTKMGHDAL